MQNQIKMLRNKVSFVFACLALLFSCLWFQSTFAANSSYKEAGDISASFRPNQISKFWTSQNGKYTFGFKSVGQDGYLLSVWHSMDKNQTALWWPNISGENPIVSSAASFNFTSKGSLHLYNGSKSEPVWSTESQGQYAELANSSNLRIQDNQGSTVWESFDEPTNSLMFTEQLSHLDSKQFLLTSRNSLSSYAPGKFYLETDNTLNVYLHGFDAFNFNYIYLFANLETSATHFKISASGVNQYDSSEHKGGDQRLTLDNDGDLRVYMWDSNISSWKQVWEFLGKCRSGSPCGPFGICSLNKGSVNCSCPPGYHARSSSGDMSLGCVSPYNSTNCGSGTPGFNASVVEVPGIDFFYFDGTKQIAADKDDCKSLCLNACDCLAATYVINQKLCYIKVSNTGYILNGFMSDGNHTMFFKVLSHLPKAFPKRLIHIGIGLVAFVIVVVTVGLCLIWCRSERAKQSRLLALLIGRVDEAFGSSAGPIRYKYEELVEATNGFSEPLGSGGFGSVFKGQVILNRSEIVFVAVKVLKETEKRSEENERQFRAEATTLGNIHHVNLVGLLGYCLDKRLLVYEYMERGSLDQYLSASRMQNQPLPWGNRLFIALGIARGIAYLHHDCNPAIWHCDIKPQNVLLDKELNPKVADFGLAKQLYHQENHVTFTGPRGTPGYIAPDWYRLGEITSKVDVYSFGMLLLELVYGFKLTHKEQNVMFLHDWAFQCMVADSLLPFPLQGGDHDRHSIDSDSAQKLQVLKIALWCIQKEPSTRPSMLRVVQRLEVIRGAQDLEPPGLADRDLAFFNSEVVVS